MGFFWDERGWIGGRQAGATTMTITLSSYVAGLLATIFLQILPAWEYSIALAVLYFVLPFNAIVNLILCVPWFGANMDLALTRVNIIFFDLAISYALFKGPLSRWAFLLPLRAQENIIPIRRQTFI